MTSLEKWRERHPLHISDVVRESGIIVPDRREPPESLRKFSAAFTCNLYRTLPHSWLKFGRYMSGDPKWSPRVNYLLWSHPADG